MEYTNEEIYKLIEKKLVGKEGITIFYFDGVPMNIDCTDSAGLIFQNFLCQWFKYENINCVMNKNTQESPDFFNGKDRIPLELKTFNIKDGPGFDIANFYSFFDRVNDELLNMDYLIIGYSNNNGKLKIEKVFLKKIWEIVGCKGKYPITLQVKKGKVYAIRPCNFLKEGNTFNNVEHFKEALIKVKQIFT